MTEAEQSPPGSPVRTSWKGPRIAAITVGILTIGLVAVLATRPSANERSQASPLLGKVAPDIEGTDLVSGRQVRLSDSAGKWTIVNFFATWCTECVKEHPDLLRFYDTNVVNGDDALFAAVFDDTRTNVTKFFEKRGGGWPVIDDEKGSIDFGVTGVPESYILAPNGTVVASVRLGITYESLVAKLDELKAAWNANGGGS
jgi:cytochrome c biogenesis protein CcmG, thiol:disulfide interchange protein DsbE